MAHYGVNGNAMDSLHSHTHSLNSVGPLDQQQHAHSALYHVPPAVAAQQHQPAPHSRYSQQLEQHHPQHLSSYDFPPSNSRLDVDPVHHPLDPRVLPISRELRHYSGVPQHQLIHSHSSQTCIPSLIPLGMDPAQVDMRTFYPYQPNEVKHRKRTTRSQLKVLEGVYEHNKKPDATLRKKLADELSMTPRGVQVWFQNRRAKTKAQAKKLEQTGKDMSENDEENPLPGHDPTTGPDGASVDESPVPSSSSSSYSSSSSTHRTSISSQSSAEECIPPSSSPTTADDAQSVSSGSNTIRDGSGPSASASPSSPGSDAASRDVRPNSESDRMAPLEIDMSLWSQPYPFGQPPAENAVPTQDNIAPDAPNPALEHSDAKRQQATKETVAGYPNITDHLREKRRISLPIIVSPPPSSIRPSGYIAQQHVQRSTRGIRGAPPGFDPAARRKSVDTNLHRLSSHPYAHLVNNTGVYGGGQQTLSQGSPSLHQLQMLRRGSMPQVFGTDHSQQQPMDAITPNGYYLSPPSARRTNMAQRPSLPASALQRFQHTYHMHSQTQNDGTLSSFDAGQPRNATYAISARDVPAPVPGPLPSPNFSFGALSATSSNTTSPSLPSNPASSTSPAFPPSLPPYMRSRRSIGGVEDDTEDDASAVSSTYDPYSRFGSMASLAGSETSLTSAYYSEAGNISQHGQDGQSGGCTGELEGQQQQQSSQAPEGFDPNMRRASCASTGHVLEMFGDLDVNSNTTPHPQSLSEDGQPLNDGGDVNPTHGDPLGDASNMNTSQHQGTLDYPLGPTETSHHVDDGSPQVYAGVYTVDPFMDNVHKDWASNNNLSSYDQSGYISQPPSHSDQNTYTSYGYSMVDSNGNPAYDTGAIELSHMCVPSSSAMENFDVVDNYTAYS